jgi:hypothetical protein
VAVDVAADVEAAHRVTRVLLEVEGLLKKGCWAEAFPKKRDASVVPPSPSYASKREEWTKMCMLRSDAPS